MTSKTIQIKGRLMDFSVPRIMGIVNMTPDSFFPGSRRSESEVCSTVEKMLSLGADIIDIGGCSTRPGSSPVDISEEIARAIPAVRAVAQAFPEAVISIDTFRAEVAREAVEAGAAIINDISGGMMDPEMFDMAARLKAPYVLSHIQGTDPRTMNLSPHYENITEEVILYFSRRISLLREKGVSDIILDPGFGFGKTAGHNFRLLKDLRLIANLGFPVLAGLSRKGMIWKTLRIRPEDALNGTSVLNTLALCRGASILRVHDVAQAVEAVKLFECYRRA